MSLPITSLQQFRAAVDYIVDHLLECMNFTQRQPYHRQLLGNGFRIDCREGFVEYKHDIYSPEARRIIGGYREAK